MIKFLLKSTIRKREKGEFIMRIENDRNIFRSYTTNVAKQAEKMPNLTSMNRKEENVVTSISQNALDINRFVDTLIAEDEIRYEKVDNINQRIENQTYHISGKDVVSKVLRGK